MGHNSGYQPKMDFLKRFTEKNSGKFCHFGGQ